MNRRDFLKGTLGIIGAAAVISIKSDSFDVNQRLVKYKNWVFQVDTRSDMCYAKQIYTEFRVAGVRHHIRCLVDRDDYPIKHIREYVFDYMIERAKERIRNDLS